MDPTGLRRLLYYSGKTCNLQEEKPYIQGRKNPISHFSRIKNPNLLYLSIVAALQAYILRPTSLDTLASLGTTTSFFSLLQLGFTTSQLYLTNYLPYLITITFISYILTIPYILSLMLTITIYTIPPSPLRPIKGVRGIYLLTTIILKQAGYYILQVSFISRPQLGPF